MVQLWHTTVQASPAALIWTLDTQQHIARYLNDCHEMDYQWHYTDGYIAAQNT